MAKLGEQVSPGAWIYALGNGLRAEYVDTKDGILYSKAGYETVLSVKAKILSEEAILKDKRVSTKKAMLSQKAIDDEIVMKISASTQPTITPAVDQAQFNKEKNGQKGGMTGDREWAMRTIMRTTDDIYVGHLATTASLDALQFMRHHGHIPTPKEKVNHLIQLSYGVIFTKHTVTRPIGVSTTPISQADHLNRNGVTIIKSMATRLRNVEKERANLLKVAKVERVNQRALIVRGRATISRPTMTRPRPYW
jgi:hypothetical protein